MNGRLQKIGYVIASHREDFLTSVAFTEYGIKKTWEPMPNSAKIIYSRSRAIELLKKMGLPYQAWVLELWGNDKQYVVTGSDKLGLPDWLVKSKDNHEDYYFEA
jgi:hypothetical protein